MTVSHRMDAELDITIFTLTGTIKSEHLLEDLRDFWQKGPVTQRVLWDLGQATGTNLNAEEMSRMVASILEDAGPSYRRFSNRIAIFAPSDLVYGFARMYQAMQAVADEGLPWEVQVFRERREAMDWLFES